MNEQPHHSLLDESLEKKVATTLIVNDVTRKYLIKTIPYQAFYFTESRLIVKLLHECVREDKPIDSIFFVQVLGNKILPELIADYFSSNGNILTHKGCEWGVARLKELYYNRVAWNVGNKIRENAVRNDIGASVKLANTLGTFKSKLFTADEGDVIDKTVDSIMSPDEYIQSPYKNLYDIIGGFTKRDVTTLFAKSGHNKTTFALSICRKEIQLGFVEKILYCSLDEPGEMIFRRIIASDLQIKTSDMRHKRAVLTVAEVRHAVETIYKNKLIILDNIYTADEIATAIMDIKPTQVVIDHVQEMEYEGGISDAGVTVSASKIKRAARFVGANCLFLSQVRDKVVDERVIDKIPRPHDMLYASHLRVKSRELLGLYWLYKDSQNKDDKKIFDVYIYKSTYSDTGVVKFEYNPEYAEFTPLENQSRASLAQPQKSIWD